jgi:hypothetical protein
MQWWGALTQQFQGIAAAALKDVAADAMKAGVSAKKAPAKAVAPKSQAAKASAKTPIKSARKAPAKAAVKTVVKAKSAPRKTSSK